MKPTRRGFLGGMLAAPVAAPAVLDQLKVPATDLGVTDFGAGGGYVDVGRLVYGDTNKAWTPAQELQYVKDEFKAMMESVDPLRDWVGRIERLDPDIATSRSLSLGAKMRLQGERDRNAYIAGRTDHFTNRIAEMTKKMGLG